MHRAVRTKTLVAYIAARITEREKELIKVRAETAGLTESEWCRQVLVTALDVSPELRFLAGELMAIPGLDPKGLGELQRKVDAGKDEAAWKRWKQFAAAMTDGGAEQ